MDYKWIIELKINDIVFIQQKRALRKVKIDKITKKHIIIGKDKYRKSDGLIVTSDPWDTTKLKAFSEENIIIYNTENILSYLRSYNFSILSYETLKELYNICKENHKKGEKN